MTNPRRDLPRVLNTAMIIVLTSAIMLNTALYAVLPIQVIRERLAVAVVSASSCRTSAVFVS